MKGEVLPYTVQFPTNNINQSISCAVTWQKLTRQFMTSAKSLCPFHCNDASGHANHTRVQICIKTHGDSKTSSARTWRERWEGYWCLLVTFSFLHHGTRLSECKTLHSLIALPPRWPFFWQPMTLTVNCVHQHSTVESVTFLSGCISPPRCSVWHYWWGKARDEL